jgi:hypothetical protein
MGPVHQFAADEIGLASAGQHEEKEACKPHKMLDVCNHMVEGAWSQSVLVKFWMLLRWRGAGD